MTVEEFLAQDHMLKVMRAELTHRVGSGDTSKSGPGRRGDRARQQLAKREAELRRLWKQGLEGWLTDDEGQSVAEQLTDEAKAASIDARATIEHDEQGDSWIVFQGSKARLGSTHRLALRASSPVRVRAHWDVFIQFCPRRPAQVQQIALAEVAS